MEPNFHAVRLGCRPRWGQVPPPTTRCNAAGGSMFRNRMPRYEVLSEECVATVEMGWRRLMTEIGVEFMDDRALDLFRKAGQRVEDRTVFLDPDFVLEEVAKAPRECEVQARNPEHSIHIGGDVMAFGAVYGPPF